MFRLFRRKFGVNAVQNKTIRWSIEESASRYNVDIGVLVDGQTGLPVGGTRCKVNKQDSSFIDALDNTCSQLAKMCSFDEDAKPKPIVFRAAGSTFSAGLDLPFVHGLGLEKPGGPSASPRDELLKFFMRFDEAYRNLLYLPAPTYAAVQGHAIAGGAVFALCCDYQFVVRDVKVGLVEAAFGVPFPETPSAMLRQKLRPEWKGLVTSGKIVSSQEAYERKMFDGGLVADQSQLEPAIEAHMAENHPPPTLISYGSIKNAITATRSGHVERTVFVDQWMAGARQREQYFMDQGIDINKKSSY